MNLIEKATITHYHRHRLSEYAEGTVRALGWRGLESQVRRFEVLADLGDFSGASILDVGCGTGDLKGFLDQKYPDMTYIGIDQMPEFIALAQKNYGDATRTEFYQRDFSRIDFPSVDFVLASGALGYRCADPDFFTDMIEKMFNAAKQALAFNMLDASCFPAHPLLCGHDPDQILRFCKRLSSKVECVRGYLHDDFTVYIYVS